MATLKPSGKIAIIIMVVLVALGGLYMTDNLDMSTIMPSGSSTSGSSQKSKGLKDVPKDVLTINVGVVTYGGYIGGQYFNEGFEANANSRFYKDYGFLVNFIIIDDVASSRASWKSGDIDLLYATDDTFMVEASGLSELQPQIILQTDWSRGGDAIVVRRGITTTNDLKGKTIAYAIMTPSETLFLNMLSAAGLKKSDVSVREVANAMDAAALFKNGEVDAAVVWSPDDISCVNAVEGSKVLQSTKQASHLIADVFVVKKSFESSHRTELTNLVEGWLIGNAEINANSTSKNKAVDILATGLKISSDEALGAINNVRLVTYGDNVNFFGLNSSYNGVTGEKIYMQMSKKFKEVGYSIGNTNWRSVGNSNIINGIKLTDPIHSAEGSTTFTAPTSRMADSKVTTAVSTKQVSVTFPTGSATLTLDAKVKIDREFLDIAQSFANNRIRIAGNTDNTGSYQANVALSRRRAQAVADYLTFEHKFDRNRFVVVGNGPDYPTASNETNDGRAENRRTDFELIGE